MISFQQQDTCILLAERKDGRRSPGSRITNSELSTARPQLTYLQEFSDIRSQDTQDCIVTRFLTKDKKHLPKHLEDFSSIEIYFIGLRE